MKENTGYIRFTALTARMALVISEFFAEDFDTVIEDNREEHYPNVKFQLSRVFDGDNVYWDVKYYCELEHLAELHKFKADVYNMRNTCEGI